jgi:hypothetical protein
MMILHFFQNFDLLFLSLQQAILKDSICLAARSISYRRNRINPLRQVGCLPYLWTQLAPEVADVIAD